MFKTNRFLSNYVGGWGAGRWRCVPGAPPPQLSYYSIYDEMKKAMKQVFGNIDEREVAAQQIQKLRQHHSVREYITEFQTISSNLEWHEEAGAQRIDREHWNGNLGHRREIQ